MPAPVEVDMSTVSGIWPAFTLSGVTGTGAASINGDYFLSPVVSGGLRRYDRTGGGASVRQASANVWYIYLAESVEFTGSGAFPWDVAWDADGSAGGTPALTRKQAPPVTVVIDGAEAIVQAALTTALTGTNNDLVFTAVPSGRLGNGIRIRYVSPGTNNAALAVTVSGRDITVNLATNGSAVITSTAALVEAALEASAAASALITVANAAANNGTGVVTALAYTSLAGGTGGLPPAPTEVTI